MFVLCGGDRFNAQSAWPHLKNVDFSYNGIVQVDASVVCTVYQIIFWYYFFIFHTIVLYLWNSLHVARLKNNLFQIRQSFLKYILLCKKVFLGTYRVHKLPLLNRTINTKGCIPTGTTGSCEGCGQGGEERGWEGRGKGLRS